MRLHSHFTVLTLLAIAVGIGSWFGVREARSTTYASAATSDDAITVDPRHPVERYLVPAFVRDVASAAAALGVTLYPEDRVATRPGIEFGLGGELTITRALPITVADAGQTAIYRTWVGTVGELLGERRIEIGDRDRVEPAADTALEPGRTITITRVSVVEVTKHEPIPFTKQTVDDPNRPRGEKVVSQRGANGKKALTYAVTRENGVEVGRKLIRTEVVTEPVVEITNVGTRVINLGQGKATWYDPPWSGLTAAHNTLPRGTFVDVVNVTNGKRVTVKINDHGIQSGAVIDLSVEAFRVLAPLGAGVITVRLEIPG